MANFNQAIITKPSIIQKIVWSITKKIMPVQFRAKSAGDQAGLGGAEWTVYQTVEEGLANALNNIADNGKWMRLEVKLSRGSEPEVHNINQKYGESC